MPSPAAPNPRHRLRPPAHPHHWHGRAQQDLEPPVTARRGRHDSKWRRLISEPGGLRRSRTDRLVAGVAGGIASRMDIDPTALRIGIVLLSVFGGVGALVYVVAWLIVPTEGDNDPLARRAVTDLRGVGVAIAVFTVVLALYLSARAADIGGPTGLLWPAGLSAAGLVLVWRNAEGDDRDVLRRLGAHLGMVPDGRYRPRATVVRVVAGVVLVIGGVGGLFGLARLTSAAGGLVIAAFSVIAGFVLVLGPWWLRLGRDLAAERRDRVRSEERADMAAHLHDSVLQTLALIQRSSTNPREVTRLARAQERELRSWLFEDRGHGEAAADGGTVAGAVDLIERDVELRHGVAVDAVVVGDAPLDDDLRALLAAAREATVNAAKWSGAEIVSLFAEVEPQRASIFVRDRGRGFVVGAIDDDRRGIRESIQGRIERRGGKTVIRSAPGAGTEVELVIPRRGPSGPGPG